MSTIHQIYCTHCTHGSSALERREGELSHRMLGYSARAGSVEAVELRRYYRQVERYTYYYLPRDTPGEEKLRLTAAVAPWRMVYLPSTGGLQIVGQVVYRPTDTEGRPGSYFAHVLFRDEKQQSMAWSVLDCLKLWAAPGWVREDSSAIPFLLRPLASLDELRAGRPAAIDDRVFWSFLTTPAGGEFYDPCGVISPRWRQEDPARRRDLFVAAFHGLLEVVGQRHASLLLVIEPSMAALVFYGMFRLLPGGEMRDSVSFSTFEPNTDRLCTTLAATWFHDPQKAEVRADARTRGLVLNTTAANGWENRQTETGYARHIVDRLLMGGWSALDRMLANMQAAGAKSAEDLERLAGVDRMARTLLSSRIVPTDEAWRRWPAAVVHLRQTLADEIVALADPAGALTPLIGSASHLLILEIIAGEIEIPGTRPAIDFLLRNLPEAMIADVVKLGDIAADYKVGVLSRYVAACGRLPPGCEMVWEDRPPGGVWLLPGILARLDLPTIERLYDNAAEHHSAALVFGLVEVRNRAHGAWLPLTRIVEAVDDGTLLTLYRQHGGAFFQHYPADEPAMAQRLHGMLRSLPDHTDQFSLRLDMVSAGERLLPSDSDISVVGAWGRVRKAVLDIGRLQGQTSRILRTPPIGHIEAACRRMIEAMVRALPSDTFEDDLVGTRKQECLRRIGRNLLAGQPLLSNKIWQYAGLWQKATWYFQTGKWPAARLAKLRRGKGSPMKAAWLATGVVAAGLLLVVALWWSVAPQKATPNASPVAKKRAVPDRDAAQRAAAAKATKEKAEQERIRQQKDAQRAAAAEAARKREADEAARQKVEEDDAQRAAEEQSRRVAEEKSRPRAEEAKAQEEQATAQRVKEEAEAKAEQKLQDDTRPAPSAELKPTPGVTQLPAEYRVEVVENAYTPTYAETAKLMVQIVPAQGVVWPKWFNNDVIAICTVVEYPEEGNTRTFDLVGAVKPKVHLVIAGTQCMAVRFGFFRRNDASGASARLVAETPWHTVDDIKPGAEYRLKAPLNADALDKLRALTTNKK